MSAPGPLHNRGETEDGGWQSHLEIGSGSKWPAIQVQDDVDATFPWSGILTLLVKGKERCCVYHEVLIVGMGWRVL